MKKSCIIVASGKGKRFGGDIPKQYTQINNKPIWYYSTLPFLDICQEVVIVVHNDYIDEVKKSSTEFFSKKLADKISVVEGGSERYNSVLNGLNAIKDKDSLVAIHDSVRALIKKETIKNAFDLAIEKGNAIVYAPVVDTIKLNDNGNYSIIDRDKLLAIQTPQITKVDTLINAINIGIEKDFQGTDDSSFLEFAGEEIFYFKGDKSNIKLTTKEDLDYFTFFIDKYIK